MEAAVYYAENFEVIRYVVDHLGAEDAMAIDNAQKLFAISTIVSDLVKIKHNFSFLLSSIKMLQ